MFFTFAFMFSSLRIRRYVLVLEAFLECFWQYFHLTPPQNKMVLSLLFDKLENRYFAGSILQKRSTKKAQPFIHKKIYILSFELRPLRKIYSFEDYRDVFSLALTNHQFFHQRILKFL